jgi:hypothetical protein
MVARDLSVVGLPRSVVTQETLLDAADQLDNADTADGASLIREAAEQMPDSATILICQNPRRPHPGKCPRSTCQPLQARPNHLGGYDFRRG